MPLFNCTRKTASDKPGAVVLDDCMLRLYYRFTTPILLFLAFVITMREWSIDAIDCSIPYHQSDLEQDNQVQLLSSYHFNSYCKLHERFLPVKMQCIHQENGASSGSNSTTIRDVLNVLNEKNAKHSTENTVPKYQWFSLVFLLFALGFQFPNQLWRCSTYSLVTSTISMINLDLRHSESIGMNQRIQKSLRHSVGHVLTIMQLVVKLFNMTILFAMIAVMDHLTHYRFLILPGMIWKKLFQDEQEQCRGIISEPDDLFPKASFCPYIYMDATTNGGGTSRSMWVQCLMPINSALEQVCFFLWLWSAILVLVSLFDLLHYMALLCCRFQRLGTLKYRTNCQWSNETYREASRSYHSWLLANLVWINNAVIIKPANSEPEITPMISYSGPSAVTAVHSGTESPTTNTSFLTQTTSTSIV